MEHYIIAQSWNDPNVQQQQKKWWYIPIVEYCLTVRMNKLCVSAKHENMNVHHKRMSVERTQTNKDHK